MMETLLQGLFLSNFASTATPLYDLLWKSAPWTWVKAQRGSFQGVKDLLKSSDLLVHFDPEKQLILACDVSLGGLRAVLSYCLKGGSERPVAFESCTQSVAEQKYSQFNKEALSIVFGVKRFHQYLYGRHFVVHSDHKPLMYIFDESKDVPLMGYARCKDGPLPSVPLPTASSIRQEGTMPMQIALLDCPAEVPCPPETVFPIDHLAASPVFASHIWQQTNNYPTLSKVRRFVQNGWPAQLLETKQLQPFNHQRHKLSVEDSCLLRGSRVIVPPILRSRVVDQLHEGHPGIVKMKALTRQYVWWPGIDGDLEEKVK